MQAFMNDEIARRVSAAIAQVYPSLGCRRSRQGLRYVHPTEPSTLSVTPDADGRFRIFLEHTGPFAVIVSSSAESLSRVLDVVRNWREGR